MSKEKLRTQYKEQTGSNWTKGNMRAETAYIEWLEEELSKLNNLNIPDVIPTVCGLYRLEEKYQNCPVKNSKGCNNCIYK